MKDACVTGHPLPPGSAIYGEFGEFRTDDRGSYHVVAAASEVYIQVDFDCRDGNQRFTPMYYTTDGNAPTLIDVSTAGVDDIDVVVQPKGRVTAIVTDEFGAPVPGICVMVDDPRRRFNSERYYLEGPRHTFTDATGRAHLYMDAAAARHVHFAESVVPTYWVRFYPCVEPAATLGYRSEYFDDVQDVDDATLLTLQPGKTTVVRGSLSLPTVPPI